MEGSMKINLSYRLALLLILFILLSSCTTTTSWQESPTANKQITDTNKLSYGMVTSKVQKGITTQLEILNLFGAPNISTTDKDGNEVWVYDKISTETRQNGWSEAARFSSFFGVIVAGVGQDEASVKTGSSHSNSTRTLTVIINFDKDNKVKDYSARATQF
jgi:hypothetical protein